MVMFPVAVQFALSEFTSRMGPSVTGVWTYDHDLYIGWHVNDIL